MPAITHASSGYKSQRRDQAEGRGDSTEGGTERRKTRTTEGRKKRKKAEGEGSIRKRKQRERGGRGRVCTAKQRTQHHRRLQLSITRYVHFPSQSLQQK
jgi:hypothetical protein